MLAHSKDEGVVYRETCALGLDNVQIMPHSVRCRMTNKELIWWVVASVKNRYGESQRMRIVFD